MLAIDVTDLHPHRANVRADLGDITELAASIKAHGVLQPLVVHERKPRYWEVLDGHRRLEAAKLAGARRLPCIVSRAEAKDQVVSLMLAAAMHKGLTPMEQARAFQSLLDGGLTNTDVARRTGYSKATVSARLLLLNLPDEAQQMVADKRITVAQATDLARQVKATRTGEVVTRVKKTSYLNGNHRLAKTVAAACDHRESRMAVGGVACGQCWEQAIQDETNGDN